MYFYYQTLLFSNSTFFTNSIEKTGKIILITSITFSNKMFQKTPNVIILENSTTSFNYMIR